MKRETSQTLLPSSLALAWLIVLLLLPASTDAAQFDSSFGGGDGRVLTENATTADPSGAGGVVEDRSDRLITADSHGGVFAVTRYLPDGQLDPSLGDPDGAGPETGRGRVLIGNWWPRMEGRRQEAYANAIALQNDGKILVAGAWRAFDRPPRQHTISHFCAVVVRLNADGSADRSFANRGRLMRCGGQNDYFEVVALANGKILLSGYKDKAPFAGYHAGVVTRLNSDGSIDKSFGPRKRGTIGFIAGTRKNAAVFDLQVLRSGKIIGTGHFDADLLTFRLNRNGTFDRSFGRRGKTLLNPARRNCHCSLANGIDRDRRGRLVIVGYTQNPDYIVMARYSADGELDRDFGRRGVVRTRIRNQPTRGYRVEVQRNGRIVVAGRIGPEGDSAFALLRYLPDGSRDRSFFGDGLLSLRWGGNSRALDVISDRAGRLIAVGGGAAEEAKRGAVVVRLFP